MDAFIFKCICVTTFLIIQIQFCATAQFDRKLQSKPVIDTGVLGKWPEITSPAISNDGKYSLYVERQGGHFVANEINKHIFNILHVAPTSYPALIKNDSQKGMTIDGVTSDVAFSNDCRYVYFRKEKDSFGILELRTNTIDYITDIKSFELSKEDDWLAYLTDSDRLYVCNIRTGKKTNYENVIGYKFSNDGKALLIEENSRNGKKPTQSLLWLDLIAYRLMKIWESNNIDWNSCVFDRQSSRVAFMGSESTSMLVDQSIYYYQKHAAKAENIVNKDSPGLEHKFIFKDDMLKFSRNGETLLFNVREVSDSGVIRREHSVDVNIWNYKDKYLQSDQLKPSFLRTNISMTVAINILNKKIFQINNIDEIVLFPATFDNYVFVINKPKIYYDDSNYINVISLNDGSKVNVSNQKLNDPVVSPDDQFIVWFDDVKHQIFSCKLDSKERKIIVTSFPLNGDKFHDVTGWDTSRHCVFLTDQFDIWKIDLLRAESPINVTNGFGRRNNVVFRVFKYREGNNGDYPNSKFSVIQSEGKLLLTGFSLINQDNGFWALPNTTWARDPLKLCQTSYAWTIGITPIRAKFAQKYLLCRQSAAEFPNLYITTNLETFSSVSHLHPERAYNWLTSELVTWKMTDGDTSQGILYKPENFDPNKRYPVIFNYYAGLGNELNVYPKPNWCLGEINIPYFVSNGYFVFVPDIHYKPGRGGQNVVNSIVSAATYLSKFPYIDSTKMGLQGHSFAGWETDYLVTHSNIFAAACAAAGTSDQISDFNELAGVNGLYPAAYWEMTNPGAPYGKGATPSTRPDLYENNSPVLAVESATAPLLLVGGNLDPVVPFRQDLEMYLAMRRAGKRVWLLQYEKGSHALAGDMAKDYTIRLKQFFDYYLKDDSPPVWMTKGVRAADKGIKTGLELDTSGALP
jgi:dipeptidyl aminopeptidase/acylaminoacyl peptidase